VLLAGARLLTLTGAPGVGETRLSLQVASRVLDRFPDGVWFVELAPIRDPTQASHAVAAALGVYLDPGQPVELGLIQSLSAWQTLLVLDNCEHLVGTIAELSEMLLRACPNLQMLVTSREALAIGGEVENRTAARALRSSVGAYILDSAHYPTPNQWVHRDVE
jgi:non-specific serine/threonine protein kinase